MKWEFGYGFFGLLDLKVPGTSVPLQVDYHLRKSFQNWVLNLTLRDEEWKDVFGIKDFNVSQGQKNTLCIKD